MNGSVLICCEFYLKYMYVYTIFYLFSDVVKIIGSEDATTCHIGVLRHTGIPLLSSDCNHQADVLSLWCMLGLLVFP